MSGHPPDRAGLEARFPDGVIPPGTLVRRNPGDPSCPACQASPTGFCAEHPEYRREPGRPAIALTRPPGDGDGEEAVLGPRGEAGYDGADGSECSAPGP
jgi:hypothetical protein